MLESVKVNGRQCLGHETSLFAVCINGQVRGQDMFSPGLAGFSDKSVSVKFRSDDLDVCLKFACSDSYIKVSAEIEAKPVSGPLSCDYFEFMLPCIKFRSIEEDIFHAPAQGACFELTSGNVNFRPSCNVGYMARFRKAEDMFSTTPDKGPGLLCAESPEGECIGFASYSEEENFFPMTDVCLEGISLCQRNMIKANLSRYRKIITGDAYIFFGTYESILHSYNHLINHDLDLSAARSPVWFRKGSVVEVHSSHFGDLRQGESCIARLAELGISTVYLMPCYEYDDKMLTGRYIHGYRESGAIYSILDYYRVSDKAGGSACLKSFVEKAHESGLHVLLDFIPQGASPDGNLFREHPDWFEKDSSGNYFSSHGWSNTFSLDWARDEVQNYFIDMALYYLKEFDIDGFRIDAPHWKEPNMDRNLPYRASYTCFGSLRMMRRLYSLAKKIKDDVVFMGEVWGVMYENCTTSQCEYNIHWALYNTARGFFSGSDLQNWLNEYRYTQLKDSTKVVFLETHDTELLTPCAKAMRGSLVSENIAMIYTFCGFVPMIWYEEIDRTEQLIRRQTALRKVLGCPDWMSIDYKSIRSDQDAVFMALNREEQAFICVNFSRKMAHASIVAEDEHLLRKECEYELADLLTGQVFPLHRYHGDRIETYTKFKGKDFSGLTLDLYSWQCCILKIREYKG